MRIIATKEMEELRKIYEPYEEGCHLVKDAPPEAVEAKKRFNELFKLEYQKGLEIEMG